MSFKTKGKEGRKLARDHHTQQKAARKDKLFKSVKRNQGSKT